jgi:hypothetical protein
MSVYEQIATFGLLGDDAALALPIPDDQTTAGGIETAIAAMAEAFDGSALELFDLEPLLWGFVNLFHNRAERIARERRDVESDIRILLERQDGTEIASVELEDAQKRHTRTLEREDAFIAMREHAATLFEAETGRAWNQRHGSRSGKGVTAAVIDARDQLRAAQTREAMERDPQGTKIIIAGDQTWSDADAVWSALDRARNRVGDMVLCHGGMTRGVDHIAALWARERGIPSITFAPDFNRHKQAAPFKRNDAMLAAKPRAVILFPSESGIVKNLGQKAEQSRVSVWKPMEKANVSA